MLPTPMTPASQSAPTTSNTNSSRRVPLDKRKRTETSCDKCKARKQKCRKEPGQDSCRYCAAHRIECLTTQPRKRRLYGSVEGLGNRLAVLESLVKGLLPDADVSNIEGLRQLASSLSVPVPDAVGRDNTEHESGSEREEEDTVSLLPDQQGQVQYIGPASSFSLHVKLCTLIGSGAPREFVLFGRNAADQEPVQGEGDPNPLAPPHAISIAHHKPPADRRIANGANDTSSIELLVCAFFDHINRDFPVLHEVSFREAYELWLADPGNADPAWLCSFLCVLLLARRVAGVDFPEDQERLWWQRVQTLLPVVIFTSSITAVQAMLLAAMHLHNTNHRDACWALTGTAVRIAFAIGLHQDKVSTLQTPLARELRKMLWWTLYAFEQMQVSSYDRPSAIEHPGYKTNRPIERLVGMASYYPPEYCLWFNRLAVLLGSACRAPRTVRPGVSDESYVGPLSPATGVLRDLQRWADQIPQQLQPAALEISPPIFLRPLMLLHGMYHYTVIVLCRSALLTRATILSKENQDSTSPDLINMAQFCADSGKDLGRILLRLDSAGKFDAITWWDIWYTLAAGSVLTLDLVCLKRLTGTDLSDSRVLLSQLAGLAQRHGRNQHMPGTLKKFASIVPELYSMVDAMDTLHPPATNIKIQADDSAPNDHHSMQRQLPDISQYAYLHSTTNDGAYMLADDVSGPVHPEHVYPGAPSYANARSDKSTQSHFMDFTINNIQEWNWGDLGSLLGSEAVPMGQPHGHAPIGSSPAGARGPQQH